MKKMKRLDTLFKIENFQVVLMKTAGRSGKKK